ncbi:glycosyltransferase [Calothrix sp. NIES-4071]|nr:glycosyltransferase [Calothrix sp. NIES-4071]BAZ63920.1 glycosyltransferase [Calothrix sp. NIES-4105]
MLGQAEQLNLTDKLRWMPNLPDIWMPTGYNIADVVINYPVHDAFPATVMEAVACQRPVISTSREMSFLMFATCREKSGF